MSRECEQSFCGIGRWQGTAEVYNGQGQFVGNGADQRHVRTQENDGRIKIDLAFIGPFKFSGHYFINEKPGHRIYEGPENIGFAEPLGKNLVVANNYWRSIGLSQRFFLMMLPDGDSQISMALLSRGEELIYTVVGEYKRILSESPSEIPGLVPGTSYDLMNDPYAGRQKCMLFRQGSWHGKMHTFDASFQPVGHQSYSEHIFQENEHYKMSLKGSEFSSTLEPFNLKKNNHQVWTDDHRIAGSLSLYGGRAASGDLHFIHQQRRVWRREVVSHDGTWKTLVNLWYRGSQCIGAEYSVLEFQESNSLR